MTLQEIYKVLSSEAFLFIVERDSRGSVLSRQVYRGYGAKGSFTVTRITPTIYPMHGPVLEVEIKEAKA